MTPRNRTLFLERGHAYVYLAYGSSFMLKVSSETSGVGAGVLIRAIALILGIAIMQRNRGTERVRDLARGPGRLAAALGIDRRLDGIDLCQAGPLWLGSDAQASDEIGQSARIGITRAANCPLRFYVRGNRFVSGPLALNRRESQLYGMGSGQPVLAARPQIRCAALRKIRQFGIRDTGADADSDGVRSSSLAWTLIQARQ
jgi:DNA-3-methyladenine glycosylase